MSRYVPFGVHLTPKQRQAIGYAVMHNTTVRIRFTHASLIGKHNVELHITPTQKNKIEKARNSNKGVMITLSKNQLQYHKKGGFIGPIIAALVGSLAPVLFNRLIPDNSQEGHGMKKVKVRKYQQDDNMIGAGDEEEHGKGIYLQGHHYGPAYSGNNRYIVPANGESSGYHLAGNRTSYLPDSYINEYGHNYKPLNQKNVKRGKGLSPNYINPTSEKFQMLK